MVQLLFDLYQMLRFSSAYSLLHHSGLFHPWYQFRHNLLIDFYCVYSVWLNVTWWIIIDVQCLRILAFYHLNFVISFKWFNPWFVVSRFMMLWPDGHCNENEHFLQLMQPYQHPAKIKLVTRKLSSVSNVSTSGKVWTCTAYMSSMTLIKHFKCLS